MSPALPLPPAIPRFESAIVRRPGRIAELLANHTRAIDDGNKVEAIQIARELASMIPEDLGPSVLVGPNASWVQLDGKRTDLRGRRSLRLVLAALAENPGKVVSAGDLIARGWPDEAIRTSSAMSRLYVTILALRKLGLREAIIAQDGGYLLDPMVARPAA